MDFNTAIKLCKDFQGLAHHKDIYLCGSFVLHLGGKLYKNQFKDVDFIIHKDKFIEYLFYHQGRTVQSDLLTHSIQSEFVTIPDKPYVHFNLEFQFEKCCLFVADFDLETEIIDGIRCQKLDDIQLIKFEFDKHRDNKLVTKFDNLSDNFDDIPF